jgi:hypothetical protein
MIATMATHGIGICFFPTGKTRAVYSSINYSTRLAYHCYSSPLSCVLNVEPEIERCSEWDGCDE